MTRGAAAHQELDARDPGDQFGERDEVVNRGIPRTTEDSVVCKHALVCDVAARLQLLAQVNGRFI